MKRGKGLTSIISPAPRADISDTRSDYHNNVIEIWLTTTNPAILAAHKTGISITEIITWTHDDHFLLFPSSQVGRKSVSVCSVDGELYNKIIECCVPEEMESLGGYCSLNSLIFLFPLWQKRWVITNQDEMLSGIGWLRQGAEDWGANKGGSEPRGS